jgi:pyruvate/2-oxoglutarate/acetoin dehydrogenase E1 component
MASEIIARINEHVLMYLEAPIKRITGYDVPIPYFSKERAYLPDADKVLAACLETVDFQ